MAKIHIGLIGCGAAANKYYLPILKMHPEISEGMFFIDSNLALAQKFAMACESTNFTNDYHEILEKVKGAIIVVPHALHYQIANDFLQNRVHVLCEKPLTETITEACSLVHTAESSSVKLCVNYTRRMIPSFQMVKEIISNNEIGNLLAIKYFESEKFGWESETDFYLNPKKTAKGVLLDWGAHVVDLICWLIDSKLNLIAYADDSFGGPESLAYVKAKAGNCLVEIYLNRLLDLENKFVIQGDKGRIEGSLKDVNSIVVKTNLGGKKIRKSSKKVGPIIARPIIENFIQVVVKNEEPLIPGSSVIGSVELIEECYTNRTRFEMPWYQSLERII